MSLDVYFPGSNAASCLPQPGLLPRGTVNGPGRPLPPVPDPAVPAPPPPMPALPVGPAPPLTPPAPGLPPALVMPVLPAVAAPLVPALGVPPTPEAPLEPGPPTAMVGPSAGDSALQPAASATTDEQAKPTSIGRSIMVRSPDQQAMSRQSLQSGLEHLAGLFRGGIDARGVDDERA